MDWGAFELLTLAVVGAALIVGGIVALRMSPRGMARPLSAAATAAGVVMWVAVLLMVSVSSTGEGPSDPVINLEMSAQIDQ